MHILVTIDKNYLKCFISLVRSIAYYNHYTIFMHILSNDVTYSDLDSYKSYIGPNINIIIEQFDDNFLQNAPITKRYPKTIYYRIFAAKLLPKNIDKILYLDPDIIINGNLKKIYDIDLKDNYFAGTTNVKGFLRKFNEIKNSAPKGAVYLNTGVLLMNLKLLREKDTYINILDYIEQKKNVLTLPDQDIISAFYGDKVITLDNKIYNLSDRTIKIHNFYNPNNKINYDWVKENTIIIHYYGKNKPWKENYTGILKPFYDKFKIN